MLLFVAYLFIRYVHAEKTVEVSVFKIKTLGYVLRIRIPVLLTSGSIFILDGNSVHDARVHEENRPFLFFIRITDL